jgi:hypothetical protein
MPDLSDYRQPDGTYDTTAIIRDGLSPSYRALLETAQRSNDGHWSRLRRTGPHRPRGGGRGGGIASLPPSAALLLHTWREGLHPDRVLDLLVAVSGSPRTDVARALDAAVAVHLTHLLEVPTLRDLVMRRLAGAALNAHEQMVYATLLRDQVFWYPPRLHRDADRREADFLGRARALLDPSGDG